MTLVISAPGKDFVVLGADSRGTLGGLTSDLIIAMDDMIKLNKISKHVGFLTFDTAPYGEMLLEEFQKKKSKRLDGTSEVCDTFRGICRERWNRWLGGVRPEEYPSVGFMISGLDKDRKRTFTIPKTYTVHSAHGFFPALHKGFVCMGITSLANYILNKRYQKAIDQEALAALVAYSISETASIDRRVGGKIRIAIVDKDGYRERQSQEIEEWIETFKE